MFVHSSIKNSQDKEVDIIKILIYKENPSLLEKVDIENNKVFLEPLLFAYFNGKKENLFPREILMEILQGYFVEKQPFFIKHSYNKNGIAYIPNRGYFAKNGKLPLEEISYIQNTKIELVKYRLEGLKNIFRDFSDHPIPEDKIRMDSRLINKYHEYLTNAFQFIKKSSPQYFKLIHTHPNFFKVQG